jgi:hypothetical protein
MRVKLATRLHRALLRWQEAQAVMGDPGMASCEWIHVDDESVMGKCRNLGLVGWRAAPGVEHVRRWRSLGHSLDAANPGGSACIDLVLSGTPKISEEVRREAEQFASDPRVFRRGIAHIIELPGLAGAAVRAFISTVILVARPPAPAKAFGDIKTASTWLVSKLTADGGSLASKTEPPVIWTAGEVTAAYEALVSRLREKGAFDRSGRQ